MNLLLRTSRAACLVMLCAFALCFSAPNAHAANDQELYDPKPPADASFVRVVNVSGGNATLSGAGIPSRELEHHTSSDFYVMKAGTKTITLGSTDYPVTIDAGNYYTLALGDTAHIIKDAILENPAKSMLYFYNLTDHTALTLIAPEHNTPIFKDVASMNGTSRDINPLKLILAVNEGDTQRLALEPLTLKRRTGHSIFITGSGDALSALVIENRVAR